MIEINHENCQVQVHPLQQCHLTENTTYDNINIQQKYFIISIILVKHPANLYYCASLYFITFFFPALYGYSELQSLHI